MIQYRGAPTVPGKESPYRNRSMEENIDLFAPGCGRENSRTAQKPCAQN